MFFFPRCGHQSWHIYVRVCVSIYIYVFIYIFVCWNLSLFSLFFFFLLTSFMHTLVSFFFFFPFSSPFGLHYFVLDFSFYRWRKLWRSIFSLEKSSKNLVNWFLSYCWRSIRDHKKIFFSYVYGLLYLLFYVDRL